MKKRLKLNVLTVFLVRAGNVTRTRDLLITNQLLYQLSYSGTFSNKICSISISFLQIKSKKKIAYKSKK